MCTGASTVSTLRTGRLPLREVFKNAGRRGDGHRSGRAAETSPRKLRRAVIWSSDGSFVVFTGGGTRRAVTFAYSPLGRRNSTCSTQLSRVGLLGSSGARSSKTDRGDCKPGEGRE